MFRFISQTTMNEIKIYLNNEEAELFKAFLKYKKQWEKILNTKSGSVELHFDCSGELKQIDYHTREKLSTLPIV